MVIDDDDESEEDLNGMPNLKRSSSAPEANKKYKENKTYRCSECGKAYTTQKAVDEHIKKKHNK
jgi:predicted SprT family Zn-dependent metalloprotease